MTYTTSRWFQFSLVFFLILLSTVFVPAGALTITQSDTGISSSPVIANGDPVIIKGIATGHPRNGLQVWLVGYNYLKVSTISVDADNTFTYELKDADTRNLAPGQYYVVVQHPMMNGQFDVVYNADTGEVSNLQLSTNGLTIFKLSGSGSLQSPAGASALVQAISSQNIDDTFTPFSFVIGTPSTFINPIGDHYVGEQVTLSGYTNLASGDNLQVEITSTSFSPSQKTSDGSFSGTAKTIKVQPGTGGKNPWSLTIDTSSFRPDEYMVTVSGITQTVTGSTTFRILEPVVSAPTKPVVTVTATLLPTQPTSVPTTTLPVTQKSPAGFWPVICAGILAMILVRIKKD
ncbi:hypothetical protein [uncultured Methanoregula sp.]|uniref:hypothetical protein n=1 Tax=uncultured Methanoregula sp. TaxID=1005933 RepID=UPI002AAB467D|nr:hypothetical protein [uncultured Methanoregula sp.]